MVLHGNLQISTGRKFSNLPSSNLLSSKSSYLPSGSCRTVEEETAPRPTWVETSGSQRHRNHRQSVTRRLIGSLWTSMSSNGQSGCLFHHQKAVAISYMNSQSIFRGEIEVVKYFLTNFEVFASHRSVRIATAMDALWQVVTMRRNIKIQVDTKTK